MAHDCTIFPPLSIDKVLLGAFRENVSTAVASGKHATINLRIDNLQEAIVKDGNMFFPNSCLDIDDYVRVICILSTNAETTEEVKYRLEQNVQQADFFDFFGSSMTPPMHIDKGIASFTCIDPYGINQYICSYEFDFDTLLTQEQRMQGEGDIQRQEHLTCFAYVYINTGRLEKDFNIELSEEHRYLSGIYAQENIVVDGELNPKFIYKDQTGMTTPWPTTDMFVEVDTTVIAEDIAEGGELVAQLMDTLGIEKQPATEIQQALDQAKKGYLGMNEMDVLEKTYAQSNGPIMDVKDNLINSIEGILDQKNIANVTELSNQDKTQVVHQSAYRKLF